ncbi:MAG: hypothetical protein AB1705_01540 [Verrucomicrobiota bacterium]
MNTFQRHFQEFEVFLAKIFAWKPDYVVPVAKKACKLLKTVPQSKLSKLGCFPDHIKYRAFFELTNPPISKKRIAVIDDATQFTATLQEYRRYFENHAAYVRTFSFVGHEDLLMGKRWKEDTYAEIHTHLSEPVYQEYILQQSYHLLQSGQHFDLDHFVIQTTLLKGDLEPFLAALRRIGNLIFLNNTALATPTMRFSLDDVAFFEEIPFIQNKSVSAGPLRKFKFAYNPETEVLYFSPMVFPSWHFRKSDVGGPLFHNIPFPLPFSVPQRIDVRNKSALLRTYFNIYTAFAVSLTKALLQEASISRYFSSGISIRTSDLDAVLGTHATNSFITEAKKFLSSSDVIHFSTGVHTRSAKVSSVAYTRFADVIDDLKTSYDRAIKKSKTRVGVHFFLPYEKLFQRFSDKVSLSENLDYYCDLGALVPEIIVLSGTVTRGCRTGEPKSEFAWNRTRVLLPLAIEQFRAATNRSTCTIDPTVFNKLLSNFAFDYPADSHHELHCLYGEPGPFGTLVHVHHRHRAPSRPSIYKSERISPFYEWDEAKQIFKGKPSRNFLDEIKSSFDERTEVPYSEILSYFKLLSLIYQHFHTVDVLNMLSICREQNYFYAHIIYNIRVSVEELGLYLDKRDHPTALTHLQRALQNIESSATKLRLIKEFPKTIKIINKTFERNVEILPALERLNKNITPFGVEFQDTIVQLGNLIHLLRAFANLSSMLDTGNSTYADSLKSTGAIKTFKELSIDIPDDLRTLLDNATAAITALQRVYGVILLKLDGLPTEEQPLLGTRLRNESRAKARNLATRFVYKNNLSQLALLYLDFSGLRNIPEPKEDIIGRYYAIVEANVRSTGGTKLYGGDGGDDAFTVAYTDPLPALKCAEGIKRDFLEDLFLSRSKSDIKFGLSFRVFVSDKKEAETIECWGNAKDCCEFKGPTFRNRGYLVASTQSLKNLRDRCSASSVTLFAPLSDDRFANGEQIFHYKPISPLPSV